MKNIKFRGKSLMENSEGAWIYSNGIDYGDDVKLVYGDNETSDFWIYVDKDTVGQFTGLCDKNGKEIYGGDIVKATYEFENNETSFEIGVVKNKIHKFILENRQKYEFEIEYFDYLEVIGNVWDNPELLERGEIK